MCNCKSSMDIATKMQLSRSYQVPAEIRQELADTVEAVEMFMQVPSAELTYFFQVWNRYVAPAGEPEDITCRHCRAKVMKGLRQFRELWVKHGMYEQ